MIPHAGAMHLLDGVLSWDADRIRCSSRTHRDRQNPLRMAGNVGKRPRMGYLASLREVNCGRATLDDLEGDLIVAAERLMGEESHVIYSFEVSVGEVEVLRGRAAVVLEASRAGS